MTMKIVIDAKCKHTSKINFFISIKNDSQFVLNRRKTSMR